MPTSTASTGALVLQLPGEILGPGSEYEERRLALKKDWQPVVEAAKLIKVVDHETWEEATRLGRLLHASSTEVAKFYKPIKVQIDAMKAPVLAAENEDNAAIEEQKKQVGEQITAYNAEQERISDERDRVEREAAEKQQREDALNRAIELVDSGEAEQAEAVLQDAQNAPVAVVTQSTVPPKARGQVARVAYSVEVLDERKLIEAALKDRTLLPAIVIDNGWLNRKAGLEKESFNVPGCRLVKKQSTHFRN